ncbi:hypothetical protein WAI453_001563 [Rhynchosporium graminicola]
MILTHPPPVSPVQTKLATTGTSGLAPALSSLNVIGSGLKTCASTNQSPGSSEDPGSHRF